MTIPFRISNLEIVNDGPFLARFWLDYGYLRIPDWTIWKCARPGAAYVRRPRGRVNKSVVLVTDWTMEQITAAALTAYNEAAGAEYVPAPPLPKKGVSEAVVEALAIAGI